jgi:hypothetical protein
MFESIARADYGKLDPSSLLKLGQIVLIYEFLWNASEFDEHVLWVFHIGVEVNSL